MSSEKQAPDRSAQVTLVVILALMSVSMWMCVDTFGSQSSRRNATSGNATTVRVSPTYVVDRARRKAAYAIGVADDRAEILGEFGTETFGSLRKDPDNVLAAWCGQIFVDVLDPSPCVACVKKLARKKSNRKKQALSLVEECLNAKLDITVDQWLKLSNPDRAAWCRGRPPTAPGGSSTTGCVGCLLDTKKRSLKADRALRNCGI